MATIKSRAVLPRVCDMGTPGQSAYHAIWFWQVTLRQGLKTLGSTSARDLAIKVARESETMLSLLLFPGRRGEIIPCNTGPLDRAART